MDHGQPDAKRPRVETWANGAHNQHRALPPLPPSYPPAHSPYRPTAEGAHHSEERRHHEPGFPIPMSEPPRQMPIALPPQYNGGYAGGRGEPVVKRDPSSEPIQYQPRPNSTGHIGEQHMNPQHHDDHRRQSMAAYEGPGGPGAYRQTYPPHPSPILHNSMYEQQPYNHHPPPPSTPIRQDSYSHPYAESSAATQRKKVPRTSQVSPKFGCYLPVPNNS